MKRRSKLDIMYDMLSAVISKGEKIKPTHLLYKSNLSHVKMKEYLVSLLEAQLIETIEEKGNKMYKITDKGIKFVNEYRNIKKFEESFGL